jgi:hypothetical protein
MRITGTDPSEPADRDRPGAHKKVGHRAARDGDRPRDRWRRLADEAGGIAGQAVTVEGYIEAEILARLLNEEG